MKQDQFEGSFDEAPEEFAEVQSFYKHREPQFVSGTSTYG